MHRFQAIQLFRHFPGNGQGIPFVLQTTGSFAVGADRNALYPGHVGIQPLAALGQGLLMRINPGDLVTTGVLAGQQMMVDAQLHLATNFQAGGHEGIQGVVDHPFGGILHRHHAVVSSPGFHFTEYFINCAQRYAFHRMAKVLEGGLLGKGAFRPQERHFHALFQRQAGAHDLAEKPRHGFAVQRPLVALFYLSQYLGFPFRAIKHRVGVGGGLHLGHLVGQGGAIVEQILQPLVQLVDLLSQVVQ